jgi:hypothetical protein
MAQPEAFVGGTEKVEAKPDQNALALDSQPEIHAEEDGTWTVYKDNMPMVGGKGFESHAKAEAWLQKHLGVGKGKKKADETATPEDWTFPPPEGEPGPGATTDPEAAKKPKKGKKDKKDPPPAPEGQADAPQPPDLETATARFKELATAGGKADADFDQTWTEACKEYPADFVDEHYTELSSAFADGWELGTEE